MCAIAPAPQHQRHRGCTDLPIGWAGVLAGGSRRRPGPGRVGGARGAVPVEVREESGDEGHEGVAVLLGGHRLDVGAMELSCREAQCVRALDRPAHAPRGDDPEHADLREKRNVAADAPCRDVAELASALSGGECPVPQEALDDSPGDRVGEEVRACHGGKATHVRNTASVHIGASSKGTPDGASRSGQGGTPMRPTTRRAGILAAAALVGAETVAVVRRRGSVLAADTVVRCRSGHLFTTWWIPGASLKAVRFGWWRFQRCPVGRHWSFVTPARVSQLSDDERRAAALHHDARIP